MSKPSRKVPELRFKGFTDDWEQRKLGELCDEFRSGKNIKREEISVDGRYPVFGGNGLRGYTNTYNYDGLYALIGRQGALCGNMSISDGKAYFTEHAIAVKGNKNNETRFLFYLLSKMNLGQYSGQSAQPGLAVSKLIGLSNFIPVVLEQARISALFEVFDKTITLHQRKLDAVKRLQEAFLQNMFPKKGETVPKVRFDTCNADWKSYKADNIFYAVSDKNYPNLPVLSASQERGMVYRDDIGIDIKYNAKSLKSYKRVLPNQFVIHLRSFQGGFAFSEVEGITSPAYTIVDFIYKNEHYPLFWKYVLSNIYFIKLLESVTYGIRDGRSISFTDFSSLKFQVPPYKEQKSIALYLKQLDVIINNIQNKINALTSIKKAYLQKMFT